MKLSIITVTWNNAAGLRKTLTSCARLMQQTGDIELLIIDGASKDDTDQVVRDFSKSAADPAAIIYRSEPDKGIYDAMNKGIQLCSGSHVIFMNAGDTFGASFVPPALEARVVYYGDALFVDDRGARFSKHYALDNWQAFLNHNCFCHQALIYPGALLRQLGGYSLDYRISADFDLTLRAFLNAPFVSLRAEVAVCELGGVSHHRGMTSYCDRIRSFWCHKPLGALMLMAYAPIFYAKHMIVRLLDGTPALQAYRRLKNGNRY